MTDSEKLEAVQAWLKLVTGHGPWRAQEYDGGDGWQENGWHMKKPYSDHCCTIWMCVCCQEAEVHACQLRPTYPHGGWGERTVTPTIAWTIDRSDRNFPHRLGRPFDTLWVYDEVLG